MMQDWSADAWFFTNPETADPPEEPKVAPILPSYDPAPALPNREAVETIRSYIAAHVEKGVDCPCCDQFVRVYKRKLNANMSRFLCSLVRISLARGRGAWVNFRDCEFDGRDYPYIAMWGLAETKLNDDASKKNSGLWKPTQKGVDFVLAGLRVPSHVHVLNNRIVGWSDQMVDIRESLGTNFNYDELMR